MTTKLVGLLAGFVGRCAQPLEHPAPRQHRRLERLAFDDGHAACAQLEIVGHVARPRDDLELREVLAREIDERETVADVVDGIDEQRGTQSACRFEQIETRRVAVKHAKAKAPEHLDLIGVVIEHGGADPAREQEAPHHLAEAPEAGHDHLRVVGVDRVSGLLVLVEVTRADAVTHDEQQRRQGHRKRYREREQAIPRTRQRMRSASDAEYDECKLAALGEQGGKQPAFALAHLESRRHRGERYALDSLIADDQQNHEQGIGSEQTEVDRHAHRDEEEPHQKALEGLEVGLERMPILRIGEQHTREKGTERHRQLCECHHLRDAEHEQERERGEHLAQARAGHGLKHRSRQIAPDSDHDDDGHEALERTRQLEAAFGLGAREQGHEAHDGNRGEVLKQEHAEARASHRGSHEIAFVHGLHGDGRRR